MAEDEDERKRAEGITPLGEIRGNVVEWFPDMLPSVEKVEYDVFDGKRWVPCGTSLKDALEIAGRLRSLSKLIEISGTLTEVVQLLQEIKDQLPSRYSAD